MWNGTKDGFRAACRWIILDDCLSREKLPYGRSRLVAISQVVIIINEWWPEASSDRQTVATKLGNWRSLSGQHSAKQKFEFPFASPRYPSALNLGTDSRMVMADRSWLCFYFWNNTYPHPLILNSYGTRPDPIRWWLVSHRSELEYKFRKYDTRMDMISSRRN